jgi:hypothetical protein
MRSEVIGDLQEPYGAVLGVVLDMALASRRRPENAPPLASSKNFGLSGAVAFTRSCENVNRTSEMPDRGRAA